MRGSGRNAPFIRLSMWCPIQNDATTRNQPSPDKTTRKKTSFYHLLRTANWIEFRHVSDALPGKTITFPGQASLEFPTRPNIKYIGIFTRFSIKRRNKKPVSFTSASNPVVPFLLLARMRFFPRIGVRGRGGNGSFIRFVIDEISSSGAPSNQSSPDKTTRKKIYFFHFST